MTEFEVLGAPDPGIPTGYRGLARDIPTVVEELGLDHPANLAMLDFFREFGGDGHIPDLGLANRLKDGYVSVPDRGPFEVVELSRPGSHPSASQVLLGYDVAFDQGHESLIATILLSDETMETEVRIADLRREFNPLLNGNLLLPNEADATRFLREATIVGPWEGPEIHWRVIGLWLIEQGLS